MNKRQFLKGAAGFAATSLLPMGANAWASPAKPASTSGHWSLGWRSITAPALEPMALSLDGTLPAEVRGSLYRNGPALSERNGVSYQHWFDGDGMIQQFKLGANAISHQARFVQTNKYKKEQAAGRFLYSAAGTVIENGEASGNNDTANVANISVLPWNGELLALWEGGSAYRVDPATLATLGRKDWRDDLKHMPFSAHPLLEQDGSMWNFGSAPYAGRHGKLFVYRATQDEGVVAMQAIDLPMASYMHSFAMTERFLVFYLGPHLFERGGNTFVDSFRWDGERASRVLLVDKNDLSSQRWFEVPTGFVFHCAHAFDRGSEVVAQLCTYPTADIMQTAMVDVMHGDANARYPVYPRAQLSELRLDLKSGRTKSTTSDVLMEFPGIDPRQAAGATTVFGVGHSDPANAAWSDSIIGVDAASGKVDAYTFADNHIVEEPLFIANKTSRAADGWLVGTFLDFAHEQSGVYVLQASDIKAGPVAMARMERTIPLGFHGCFLPSAAPLRHVMSHHHRD